MTLPPLPLIDGCLFIDNSGWMEKLSTCSRALQYSQLHKRISSGESTALNFGSALHLALDLRYTTCNNTSTDPLYDGAMAAILAQFFEQHPTPMGDYRTLNHAIEVMKRYNDKYQTEEFELLEYIEPIVCAHCGGDGLDHLSNGAHKDKILGDIACCFCDGSGKQKLMVELPFAHKLVLISIDWLSSLGIFQNLPPEEKVWVTKHGGIWVIYTGRIDLPVLRGQNLYVTDHKSTSILGKGFWSEKRMAAQQKGYCWSFEQLTGMPVFGYTINAIRVSEPPRYITENREYKGKKASPEQWWDESLPRENFILGPGELDEWKGNTISLVEEFFWNYSRGHMPQKTSWCVNKYGTCPYFDVCSLFPKEDRIFLLESGNYTDNVWSPLVKPSQSKVAQ